MKKLICSLITFLVFSPSCAKLDIRIIGVVFHADELYDDYPEETEFLNSELIFGADFILNTDAVQGPANTTFLNRVIDDEIVLSSDKDFLLPNDTINAGENLMNHFEFKKRDEIYYILTYNFRSIDSFLNESGYYRFYFTAPLSDNTEVSDSCLVKINFE